MSYIRGYESLLAARRTGLAPDLAVLITDSDVIEHQWAEICRDHVSRETEEVPCNVLRIVNEEPHGLVAIRGLPVIALLARASSRLWAPAIEAAKPSDLFLATGAEAYALAERMSQDYYAEVWQLAFPERSCA